MTPKSWGGITGGFVQTQVQGNFASFEAALIAKKAGLKKESGR